MITFRLRVDRKIAGYERQEGASTFYSKDGVRWNGIKIDHTLKDKYSGLKDKNNRFLFEHDMVTVRFKNPLKKDREFRIRSGKNGFEFVEIKTGKTEPFSMIDQIKSIEFLSFTFINVDYIFDANSG